jgi:hypothetical protein
MKLIATRVPEALARQLKMEAARRGITIQELMAEVITAFLARSKTRGNQ